MLKPLTIAVIGLCATTGTVFAQSSGSKSSAECQQIWTTADANKDNMLDTAEMQANQAQMPTSLMGGGATGSGETTGSTTSADQTGSTTGSGSTGTTGSGSSDTTASNTTGSTTGSSGTTGSTSGSTSGSVTGTMISQQDFMTACTTGQ